MSWGISFRPYWSGITRVDHSNSSRHRDVTTRDIWSHTTAVRHPWNYRRPWLQKGTFKHKCRTFISHPFLDRHKSGPPSSLALLLNVTVGEKVQLFFLRLFQFNLAYSHHIDSKQPVWNQPPCTLATPWILTIWNNSDSQLVHGKSALSNYMLKK